MDLIKSLVRDVPDFPKEGILFRDITPVLEHPEAFRQVIDSLADRYRQAGLSKVVGIESRGFIFGAPLAYALGIGFVLIRKPGKLPRETYCASYALEYGEDKVELHRDALAAGDKVVIMDDLIATGGTARAAVRLVEESGATVHEIAALIELEALQGRKTIGATNVHALLTY